MNGTADRVAAGLRAAYESADLDALGELLHPDVRWGGDEDTPDTCHNRSDVLAWYRRSYESGMRATVTEALTGPDAVLLALRVSGRAPGDATVVHQVFRLTDGLVADIRGYPERELALARLAG
jgi:ketosteroid isomerase-like protein